MNTRFLKYSVCAATLVTALFAGPVHAAALNGLPSLPPSTSAIMIDVSQSGAQSFIDGMAGRAIEFLGNSSMSQAAKKQKFEQLLRESFDMDTIGRFALGRYWKTATDAQKKEYMTLFRRMIIEVYSGRFSDYKGQKFETRGARPEGDKDTLVTSFIIPSDGPEIQVDWRVRHKDGRYRVVDVIVEGVSMSVTQRSDFAAVIQRGGGDIGVLLTHLRGKV
jgi:phospholipid transport system substrate-binding protein